MHQLHSSHLTFWAFSSEKERFPAPPTPPPQKKKRKKKKVLSQKQFTGQAPSLARFVRSPTDMNFVPTGLINNYLGLLSFAMYIIFLKRRKTRQQIPINQTMFYLTMQKTNFIYGYNRRTIPIAKKETTWATLFDKQQGVFYMYISQRGQHIPRPVIGWNNK